MLTPQFLLPVDDELYIDLFAGGGGASTGIEQAIGRAVDIAINHDPEAVAMHMANHPQTTHYISDVFEVDPVAVCEGRPVAMLWASPDCKHFSKAKGGKPVEKKIRGLAWVVIKWAKLVRPRVIMLENVEEFQHWGPLDAENKPCPHRKGRTFRRWKTSLENLGYKVDFREDKACDFGAPTLRKRLFLIARCDGMPIVFPDPSHADPKVARKQGLKPWRTAAECIDWSIPCPSIFERERELAEATKRRVAKGIMRYVVNAAKPFIVPLTHQGGARVERLDEPMRTVTAAHRGEKAIVVPHLTKYHGESAGSGADAPFPTITANSFKKRPGGNPPMALVETTLAPSLIGIDNAGARTATWRADEPLRTTTTENRHALVTAFLAQHNNHQGVVPSAGRPATAPLSTVTTKGCQQGIITSNLIKLRGTSKEGQSVEDPLHTVSAQGNHHAEVRAFLIKYYGTDQDPSLGEPLHTITTKHRFGVVTVKGVDYAIVDIGLRMLSPPELYKAQGFPDNYITNRVPDTIEILSHGHKMLVVKANAPWKPLTKTAQVRMCGNSVSPYVAKAYVLANCMAPELRQAA